MFWFDTQMRVKPEKVVIRLKNREGDYLDSINIPTVMWPLNGVREFFNCLNCEEIIDPSMEEIVNALPYKIGHCYSNAEAVTSALCAAGYNAKQYCGWLFVSGNDYPIHHSWTVVNGKHVIDLADDSSLIDYNHENFDKANNIKERRELLVSFQLWASKLPHSQRCIPFGKPGRRFLYVGCPCDRETGIQIYNNLSQVYPNHPCNKKVRYSNGMTQMQAMLADAGLMEV